MTNQNFNKALAVKDNEFYTQLKDIENELQHYKEHLKGKVIFCNCDDPDRSNFWKYFVTNFQDLHLRKVICTNYESSVAKVFEGGREADINLRECGDFASNDCVDLLKQSDIVITNPPFSLFRKYIALLMEHDKKFLIIGNMGAVIYKEIFPLIKHNKMWFGVTPRGHVFKRPDGSETSVNSAWFTNLPNKRQNQEFVPVKEYNARDYPKYDNYDAIEVDRVKNIPMDYAGEMGVPITFLEKINLNQFEIINMCRPVLKPQKDSNFTLNGRTVYMRVIVKWRQLPELT